MTKVRVVETTEADGDFFHLTMSGNECRLTLKELATNVQTDRLTRAAAYLRIQHLINELREMADVLMVADVENTVEGTFADITAGEVHNG